MDSSDKSSVVFNIIIFNSKGESFVIQNATQVKAEEVPASTVPKEFRAWLSLLT